MWIHHPTFSASVVADNERDDLLLVRFRSVPDGRNFISFIEPFLPPHDLEQQRAFVFAATPGRHDYRYRLFVRREYFTEAMQSFLIDDLTYHNFKNEAAKHNGRFQGRQSTARMDMLNEIWGTGYEFQQICHSTHYNYAEKNQDRPPYRPERAVL